MNAHLDQCLSEEHEIDSFTDPRNARQSVTVTSTKTSAIAVNQSANTCPDDILIHSALAATSSMSAKGNINSGSEAEERSAVKRRKSTSSTTKAATAAVSEATFSASSCIPLSEFLAFPSHLQFEADQQPLQTMPRAASKQGDQKATLEGPNYMYVSQLYQNEEQDMQRAIALSLDPAADDGRKQLKSGLVPDDGIIVICDSDSDSDRHVPVINSASSDLARPRIDPQSEPSLISFQSIAGLPDGEEVKQHSIMTSDSKGNVSLGDQLSGAVEASSTQLCFSCKQAGHFARDCPLVCRCIGACSD